MDKKPSKIKDPRIFLLILLAGLLFSLGQSFVSFYPQSPPAPESAQTIVNQPTATASATLGINGEKVLVTRVVDGDTIVVEGNRKVRYIGVDTPETVDPRRPVGCFGKEASAENKKLVEGKTVILTKDVSETDQFGRLLRLVYLPLEDGNLLFVNDYLVREGFAKASTYPPDVKFVEQFRQAEEEARVNNRGLWKTCSSQ